MLFMPDHMTRIFINEAFRHRLAMVAMFVVISVAMLLTGLVWPKGYSAYTTILVDEKNIIQPLMQGAAVTTEVGDRSRMAREVIFGRKIMNQIMSGTGLLADSLTPDEQERILKMLMRRTTITNVGRNLIKIEFRDDDPERAFMTTRRYAELFISESLNAKSNESQAAFDFIDKQVREYHEKLARAEAALKEFRSENLDAQPGADADISTRLNVLQTRIEGATQELRETEIKKRSLERQLSGEAEVVSAVSRENQYRARIAELQSQLDTLRLSYHDTYPDVVRLRHQIGDLNLAIADERQRREQARQTGRVTIDETVINNPMYQQLRRELSATQIQVETLHARIAEAKRQMQAELERGKRMQGGAATLAELTRDYQVNREIYQDLLKRRENARVSMNLDRDNQGLTFKIQEPAVLPLQPSGLRFWHFIVGAFVFGLAVPIVLLYVKLHFDSRVRLASMLADRYKLPVLATVPQLWSPSETAATQRNVYGLLTILFLTVASIAAIVALRLFKVV